MGWIHTVIRWGFVGVLVSLTVFAKPEDQSHLEPGGHPHAESECTSCHRPVASLGAVEGPSDFSARCLNCHSGGDAFVAAAAFHRDSNRACTSCHSYHEPRSLVAGGRTFTMKQPGSGSSCRSCHDPRVDSATLSPGHRLAAQLFHSDESALSRLTDSEKCLLCHSEERATIVEGASVLVIPRFSERYMHPVGEVRRSAQADGEMSFRSNFDPRLVLNQGQIECTTCHNLTVGSKYLLVAFASPRELCLGCHDAQ